jgi:phenylacetate-CoA ligase
MRLRSSIAYVSWPAIMTGQSAMLSALMYQYEKSQWWTPEQLFEAQFGQLSVLADHTMRTVPYHAERLMEAGFKPGQPMTPEIWRRLPVLTRDDVRDHEDQLKASGYPPSFGPTSEAKSGGSTGIPVRVLKTAVDGLMWQAAHLREMKWYAIDMGLELANSMGMSAEKHNYYLNLSGSIQEEGGLVTASWGPPIELLCTTGPMGIFQPHHPLERQAAFLLKRRPAYLRIMPSALRLLLGYFREQGLTLDSIRSVWTRSEVVDESLRELCGEIFGCRIFSNYSCNETGYIALQCPKGTNFHVVSESVLVEVVDDQGNACSPGEIGRVLVTPLHNFAMPLLRYQVGDEAEVGTPCSCGRGLKSLKRIVGRMEDYVRLRSGERRRLDLEHYKISQIRAVKEFQLVQNRVDHIELRLVVFGKLSATDHEILAGVMRRSFEGHLAWSVVMVDSLPRTRAGKLRQFRSEVQTADKT